MNRKSFFKTLLSGIGAIAIFPRVLAKEEPQGLRFDGVAQEYIIPPDCLYDGNTEQWFTSENVLRDKNGSVTTWLDISGNNNHAKCTDNAIQGEVIIRSVNDSQQNRQAIYTYLKRKNGSKY